METVEQIKSRLGQLSEEERAELGAEIDLHTAAAYYDRERPGLGRELNQEVEAAIHRIRNSPQMFPIHDEFGTRKCLVPRFPYTVFFLELEDHIWIAAVAHQKRRPG